MDDATLAVIARCTTQSDLGQMPFPLVIDALSRARIERYHADLVRAERTYFTHDGASRTLECAPLQRAPVVRFDPAGIVAAIRDVQAGAVDYRGFCAKIAGAGCVGYLVSLPGRRAVYYGRTAEMHVEAFPDPA